jgi:hypothetical protein
MRKILKLLLIPLATYSILLVAFFFVMRQRPETFSKVMSKIPSVVFMAFPFKQMWLSARAGTLKVGEQAPDFFLESYDKQATVQLSRFRGERPVVLVFGSYT